MIGKQINISQYFLNKYRYMCVSASIKKLCKHKLCLFDSPDNNLKFKICKNINENMSTTILYII